MISVQHGIDLEDHYSLIDDIRPPLAWYKQSDAPIIIQVEKRPAENSGLYCGSDITHIIKRVLKLCASPTNLHVLLECYLKLSGGTFS